VMQQAAKSIRVRNAGDDLRPRLLSLPCAKAHGGHVSAHGAAGAVKRPVVPHAPSANKEQEDRQALGPDETRGDDARLLCRSTSGGAVTSDAR